MARVKNVILIMTDQQRHDTFSCLKHPVVQTPTLDAIARNAVQFTSCHCTEPLCVPSRISIFRGQYPHRTGAIMNRQAEYIDGDDTCLLDVFRANGYRIGLAGKNHAFTDSYIAKTFDYREEYEHAGKTHGNLTFSDREVTKFLMDGRRVMGLIDDAFPFPAEVCPTYRTVEDGLRFVEQSRSQPFFLFLSFGDPHFPHIVPEPFASMYSAEELPEFEAPDIDWSKLPFTNFLYSQTWGIGATEYTIGDVKRILATYYGQISYVDAVLVEFFDKLKSWDVLEDTVIIYMSDHGDFGGRYGLMGKIGLYDVLMRVPLIMRIPQLGTGRQENALVSTIDILPTVLDLLGIEIPGEDAKSSDDSWWVGVDGGSRGAEAHPGIQGRSFRQLLEGDVEEHRKEVFAEGGYFAAAPLDDLSREILDVYYRMEEDWDTHFRQFNMLRGQGEESGNYRWSKRLFKQQSRRVAVKCDGWKYEYAGGDKDQLYNLNQDPLEANNLATDPQYAEVRLEMLRKCLDWAITEPYRNDWALLHR
jgi:arylsulfatase A-like enzyme